MQDMPADVFQLDSMSSIVHAVDVLPAGHQAYNLLKSDLTVSDEVKLQCPTPSTLPSEQSNGANVSPNITSPRAAVSISSPRFCKGRGGSIYCKYCFALSFRPSTYPFIGWQNTKV